MWFGLQESLVAPLGLPVPFPVPCALEAAPAMGRTKDFTAFSALLNVLHIALASAVKILMTEPRFYT